MHRNLRHHYCSAAVGTHTGAHTETRSDVDGYKVLEWSAVTETKSLQVNRFHVKALKL